MQEKSLFEYAVIRIVPRVEREEFLNVGVVLFCRDRKFLQCKFHLDLERIRALYPHVNIEQLDEYLCAFRAISEGDAGAGPIGQLPMIERFRWLTAARSTMLQTSSVHSGLCIDPNDTLNGLYEKLVLN
jgi:Protein of unknown function (DUF3037)